MMTYNLLRRSLNSRISEMPENAITQTSRDWMSRKKERRNRKNARLS
jgi:hypothetical protein